MTLLCTGQESSFLTLHRLTGAQDSQERAFLTGAQDSQERAFLTGAQDSHLQRVTIPEAAYIQLRRRPPEDEQGNARNM